MRPLNARRARGRPGGGNRRSHNAANRNFDSNGPNVRIRGTASQVFDKYCALARDANASGDRVAAENYMQHAEHYYRILNANGSGGQRGQQSQGQHPNQNQNQGQTETDPQAPAEVRPVPGTGPQPTVAPPGPAPASVSASRSDEEPAEIPVTRTAD